MTTDWTTAACATKDPTEWDRETEYAYHHCQACPLMARCLQKALLPEDEGGTPYGMRGGWTSKQRKYFKRHGKMPRPIKWEALDPSPHPAKKNTGNRLTQEQNRQRMTLYKQRMTDGEIAAEVGVEAAAIESWRRKRKLPINNNRRGPLTANDENHRMQAWEIGLTDNQAAQLLKCSVHSYRMWRRRRGLKLNRRRELAS